MKNEHLKQKLDRLQIVRLPRWTDLPDLELYMDQVVSYINQYLNALNLDEITASMINNYVKKKKLWQHRLKKTVYKIANCSSFNYCTIENEFFD